jgi:SAM-dependent methyltransferase
MYFDALDLWQRVREGRVLHIAPERYVAARIWQNAPLSYVQGDLRPRKPRVQTIDACDIALADASVDVVICNHVLEHVEDDARALAEIHRVLAPGGVAVLQTPYSAFLRRGLSDEAINTPELRAEYYGQFDHVRVYGRDLPDVISAAGFVSVVTTHDEVLQRFDPREYGVDPREPLMRAFV